METRFAVFTWMFFRYEKEWYSQDYLRYQRCQRILSTTPENKITLSVRLQFFGM